MFTKLVYLFNLCLFKLTTNIEISLGSVYHICLTYSINKQDSQKNIKLGVFNVLDDYVE